MRSIRPPTFAALAILLTAVAVIGMLTLRDTTDGDAATTTAADDDAATETPAEAAPRIDVINTTNAYDRPSSRGTVTIVVPGRSTVSTHGRTETGDWLLVSWPVGSTARGWIRATAIAGTEAELAAAVTLLDVIAIADQQTVGESDDEALPDLTIADAFLLQTGQLAISLRNSGAARLPETVISLHVARAEGDILGVLRIGPTELAAGASATVVTPVEITEPGTYRLEIDPTDEIVEERERNNDRSVLLIPQRSADSDGTDDDTNPDGTDATDDAADGADDDAA